MDTEKLERYLNESISADRMSKDKWTYDDACMMFGAMKLYEAGYSEALKDFVIAHLDSFVQEDGTILHYKKEDYNLDNIAGGRALLFAYEHTGEERYRLAAFRLWEQLKDQPRTASGNFWHKKIYPNQVWLDGLFMAQPFYAECETKYARKEHYFDIVSQFQNVRKNMYSEENGLYYHGYDESKRIFWADPDTGCSANFWLRSEGWHLLALEECACELTKGVYEHYRTIQDLLREAVKGILARQDEETGLFYQLTALKDLEGNYLETSGSAMIAAAILGGCRQKLLLSEKYRKAGERILSGLISHKLVEENGRLVLKDNCRVAGLGPEPGRRDGSAAYYLSEAIIDDDKRAVGALMAAYAQYLVLCRLEGEME